ncbi:VRR-NUC domain containing protein [uncultured Caudovirales phage]|uniref:VRR-NUC domain containing protein n=1 Tax=uncultured Caudovirales phage TaxID=2100421 RepID=A0A6J5S658_9CAUD|nr:VRR-NUC domain containing protein [uncultured Caudovirales phage]
MNYQTKIIKEMESEGYTVIKVIRLSDSGYPDLLCMKLGYNDTWIECKEKNDTLKELQKFRIDELNKLGKNAFCTQNGKGVIYPII